MTVLDQTGAEIPDWVWLNIREAVARGHLRRTVHAQFQLPGSGVLGVQNPSWVRRENVDRTFVGYSCIAVDGPECLFVTRNHVQIFESGDNPLMIPVAQALTIGKGGQTIAGGDAPMEARGAVSVTLPAADHDAKMSLEEVSQIVSKTATSIELKRKQVAESIRYEAERLNLAIREALQLGISVRGVFQDGIPPSHVQITRIFIPEADL